MQFGSDLSLLALTFYGIRDLLSYLRLNLDYLLWKKKSFDYL